MRAATKTAVALLAIHVAACDVGGPDLTPPTVDFGFEPSDPRVGMEVTFTAAAQAGNGTIIRHAWDFDGDGVEDATGEEVPFTYDTSGDFEVSLVVTDHLGSFGEATHTVSVGPPYARVTITSVTIEEMPFTTSSGEPWDEDSGPDVYFVALDESDREVARSEVISDVAESSLPIAPAVDAFTITELSEEYRIRIFDADEEGEDEFIRGIGYVFENLAGEYPDRIRLNVGSGVGFLLDLEWGD